MTDACIFRARQSSLQELHDQHGMEMGTNFIEAKSRFTPVSLINQMPIKYVDCPRPSSTSSKLFVIFEFKSNPVEAFIARDPLQPKPELKIRRHQI